MSDIGSENPDIRTFRIGGTAIRIRFEIFGYPNFFGSGHGFSDLITRFSDRTVDFFEI